MFVAIDNVLQQELEVETDSAGSHFIVTALAECFVTGRFVTLDCELAYVSHAFERPYNRWFHEFSFQITCHDALTNEVFSTQDRHIASAYLPDGVREHVMSLVEASLRALVSRVKPAIIYRVAKAINPPPKAFAKHEHLTHMLISMGYVLCEQGTDGLGRMFWIMKK